MENDALVYKTAETQVEIYRHFLILKL